MHESLARFLAALGSEHRLAMVELLRDGERCVCEITPAFRLDPSVVSRHLTVLEQAGVIRSRRDGRRIFYRLADRGFLNLLDNFSRMLAAPAKARPDRAAELLCCAPDAKAGNDVGS